MSGQVRFLLPAALFLVLGVGLALALFGAESSRRGPSMALPSALVGKPAPAFALPPLAGDTAGFATADLAGEVTIVNVFAQWCAPCLAEHPLLMRLAKEPGLRLFGINYKDKDEKARAWLAEHGNPFARVGADRDGRVSIDWGVYGVPETFVVDRAGVIRYRHAGPLTEAMLRDEIRPLLKNLRQ
jgi:cytochrome c biogenesis protein CcmG/thiol:disulfide interchange protein DsbE